MHYCLLDIDYYAIHIKFPYETHPTSFMYCQANNGQPPSQPEFLVSQSTSCCADNTTLTSLLLTMANLSDNASANQIIHLRQWSFNLYQSLFVCVQYSFCNSNVGHGQIIQEHTDLVIGDAKNVIRNGKKILRSLHMYGQIFRFLTFTFKREFYGSKK